MKKKTFEINNISSKEVLNQLSIAINEIEQVNHLKIGKNNITFSCIDIDALYDVIKAVDNKLTINEVINGEKRNYDFSQTKEKKYYFMFKNILNEEDVLTFINNLKTKKQYHDVTYDIQNKLLVLTTSQKDVFHRLKEELKKMNPSIEIDEYHKPIRSQDVFKEKYLRNYIKIAFILIFASLALVTNSDHLILSTFCWIVVILMVGEKIVKSAFKNMKAFHVFHEDVLVLIGIILGVVAGYVLSSIVALVFYMCLEPFKIRILQRSFNKINRAIEKPEVGIRDNNGQEEIIPLSSFEEGDVMIIESNEVIPIYGYIVEGESIIDTYPNTSSYELKKVGYGDVVHSGDINMEGIIKVKIRGKYERGNLAHILNIASHAPVYLSRIEKYMQKVSYWYTPLMSVMAVVVGIVMPLINFEEYGQYMSVGVILFLISSSFSTEQSSSIGMLAGYAKAFQQGIYVESSLGLDSINSGDVIIYDTIDNSEIHEEELLLFDKLSHLGRVFIVFNDGNRDLGDKKYKIYNYPSIEEKLEIIENCHGNVIYIGDSFKDIECFQKSFVAISRGGISHSKIVENSDIILMDNNIEKVYQVFKIARKIRTKSIVNLLLSMILKIIFIILTFTLLPIPFWTPILYEAIITVIVMYNAVDILR